MVDRRHRRGPALRRAAVRPADDLYIPPDALEVFLEAFEGPARPAALPDPAAELQHPRHPAGERDAAVPRLRRADPRAQPRAGQRLPADGGDADRDQVAHAAAAEEDGRRQGDRGPARRARAPAGRVRADEAGRGAARCAAAARPRLPARAGRSRRRIRWPRLPDVVELADLREAWARASSSAPARRSTTASRASTSACAST